MRLFRDEVARSWLANSCATARCHGWPDAGRLRLTNKKPGMDAAVYTNFLILDRFRMADGRALINYDEPAKSPLLDMALPRDPARISHPSARGSPACLKWWATSSGSGLAVCSRASPTRPCHIRRDGGNSSL